MQHSVTHIHIQIDKHKDKQTHCYDRKGQAYIHHEAYFVPRRSKRRIKQLSNYSNLANEGKENKNTRSNGCLRDFYTILTCAFVEIRLITSIHVQYIVPDTHTDTVEPSEER